MGSINNTAHDGRKTIMERIFKFGKIAFASKYKYNQVEVVVEVDENNNLSIYGDIWNRFHTDIVCGGQCLDTIHEYIKNPVFLELFYIWKKYHLNNRHAGSERQDRIIYKNLDGDYDCDKAVAILKENNMYNDNGIIYGKGWYKREIPQYVLDRIKFLCQDITMAKYWA